MTKRVLFTSESVTEGHPDKMADQISDAILDAILARDPDARVACETFVTTGMALVGGEISTTCYVDIPKIIRDTVRGIGYTRAKYGFDGSTCAVLTSIDEQSPDIALGVNQALEAKEGSESFQDVEALGAGDQGMMFGFACDETPELMPLPIMLAHKLVRKLSEVRRAGELDFLRPDGKSQVSVEYSDGRPSRIEAVVVSTQHSDKVSIDEVRREVKKHVIDPVLAESRVETDSGTRYHINPTGRFVIGGPHGDTGLTGRKIIVDTYGGMGRHGGGAFSGKDPTKVDRSACYMARHIAKNIVAAGLARRCEVQLAYAIGVAEPVSVGVNTFETGQVCEQRLVELVRGHFPLTPKGMIDYLKLRRPIYRKTAAFGHFGRTEESFSWEATDKAELLKEEARATTTAARR